MVVLTACESDKKEVAVNLSGIYLNGVGSIDGDTLVSFNVSDRGQSINVEWTLDSGVLSCTYVHLESVDSAIYFVTIPEGNPSLLFFKIIESGITLKTLGQIESGELDRCKMIQIQTNFINMEAL